MAKRINWQYANIRDKVYNKEEIKYDWREVKAFNDIKCEACQRRIKKGQKMLWNVNTKTVMHIANECKLW
jgi:hypothetical protein